MITPADTPSSPSDYAAVTPHGIGTAPYDIQAPQQDLSAIAAASQATAMARQPATERLLASPQGYADFDITAGFSGGGGESWPNDPTPGG